MQWNVSKVTNMSLLVILQTVPFFTIILNEEIRVFHLNDNILLH